MSDKLKLRAVIQSISEITTTDEGAKWLSFEIKTISDWATELPVKIYKKAEYAEHAENFVKYNKVGDVVDLELSLSGNRHNGNLYVNLNLWKIEKVKGDETEKKAEPIEDDLPF